MREIKGSNEKIRIGVMDEPGSGGANHSYTVAVVQENQDRRIISDIRFQKGPILEKGINGLQNEDLLQIVADRLYSFQSGTFKSWFNEKALTAVEEAIHWLNRRTEERQARGVEGQSKE